MKVFFKEVLINTSDKIECWITESQSTAFLEDTMLNILFQVN